MHNNDMIDDVEDSNSWRAVLHLCFVLSSVWVLKRQPCLREMMSLRSQVQATFCQMNK